MGAFVCWQEMALNIVWQRFCSLKSGDSLGEATLCVESSVGTELQAKCNESLGQCTMEDMYHRVI